METKTGSPFVWEFHSMGGLDQVQFKSGEDICRLAQLDPKLWVALSCPAHGLEFDQRTLFLIDGDKDGRIRIPEVMDAAEWLCSRLKNPDLILNPGASMPVDAIDDSTEEGMRLVKTARNILAALGRKDDTHISQEDVIQASSHASEQLFNGDGILPPADGLDDDIRAFIGDAIAVQGGVADVGGAIGINKEIAGAFIRSLARWRAWNKSVGEAETPLGEKTSECWDLLMAIKSKVDDYFLRCELIAYAPTAKDDLNLEDKPLTDQNGLLEQAALEELPLSKAGPDRPLDLQSGLNPTWRRRVERFAELTEAFLSTPGELTRADWLAIQNALAPFAKALAGKPVPPVLPDLAVPPSQPVDLLGDVRVAAVLDSDVYQRFLRLADQDANGPAASLDIAKMERLVLYYLHLYRLLINFVNFGEFFSLQRSATFQSGQLYIDGRSCHLCMPAGDVENHAAIAAGSHLYLLYCACTRGRKAGEADGEKKMNIVAAVTAGDADLLTVRRNGVYVDNLGHDWDATVVKIIVNPISVWQAIWTPYKRIGNLVTDQITKYADTKNTDIVATAGKKLDELAASAANPAKRFDIGRNVGIFAAVGLALGALGTAVGSIFSALLSMKWWQIPILFFVLFAIVSGPSMFLAWLKLRQRTLGPLLEASGWAVNGRVGLNATVAKCLSAVAALPANARRSAFDNMLRTRRLRRRVLFLAAGVGALIAVGVLGGRSIREWLERTRVHVQNTQAVVQAQLAAAAAATGTPTTPAPALPAAAETGAAAHPPSQPAPEAPTDPAQAPQAAVHSEAAPKPPTP